jgi:hypothetical protein
MWYYGNMEKYRGGAGLVLALNLILGLAAAGGVYFGLARPAAGRGEDVRLAAAQIAAQVRDNVLSAFFYAAPSRWTGAVQGDAAAEGDSRDMNAVYASFWSEITAKRQRETIEENRLAGLLARIEASVKEKRYTEAQEIAREMEIVAQQRSGDSQYRYLARSIALLVENAGGRSQYEESLGALQKELGRLNAERESYSRNLRGVQMEQRFAESALSLQESNAQIQQMLLVTLQEEYEKSQAALSETRARLNAGETLALREARERTQAGYQEGITEARDILEQSLRIRNRDSRIAFLEEIRTRYDSDTAMTNLINTLLERL